MKYTIPWLPIFIAGVVIGSFTREVKASVLDAKTEKTDCLFSTRGDRCFDCDSPALPNDNKDSLDYAQLRSAILNYDLAQTIGILERTPGFKTEQLDAAIELAAKKRTLPILKVLLCVKKGEKITDPDSLNPYDVDSEDAQYERLRLLCLYDPDFRQQYMCETETIDDRVKFYLDAARKADYDVLELIDFGSDQALTRDSCEGETMLTAAVRANDIRLVKFLLDKGVDKDRREIPACSDEIELGPTAYEIAESRKFTAIMELLEQY